MASLKEIMNVDDDHAEPTHPPPPPLKRALEPDPRPPHGPESSFPSRSTFHQQHQHSHHQQQHQASASLASSSRSTSTSRTSPLAAYRSSPSLPYPQTARVGSSPTSAPSLSVASSSVDLGFRRRSSASADSMDSYHGHSTYLPDRTVSSSAYGSTMRPGLPATGEAPQVKLTPITKRVSKAKKGLAVHECDICSPPKNFTRAEHLRRHQLSHKTPDLQCTVPGCDKVFYRDDLLKRHQQRHEQEQQLTSYAPSMRPTSGDPSSGYPSSGYSTMGHLNSAYATPGPSSRSASGPAASDSSWPQTLRPAGSNMSTHDQYSLGSTLSSTMLPGDYAPRTSPSVMSSITSMHTPESRWPDTSAPPSTSSSVYTTPSDGSRLTHLPRSTLSEDWVPHIPLAHTDPSSTGAFSATLPLSWDSTIADSMTLPLTSYSDDAAVASIYGTASRTGGDFGGASSTVRSLSPTQPQMAVAQSSETLVTAPTPLSTDRLIEPPCQGWQQQGFKTTSDSSAAAAVTTMAAADSLTAPGLTQTIRQAIPRYVEVFWEKVAPIFPIVHRTSLEVAVTIPEHRDLLASAMAAVATQYLESPDDRVNGSQLHAYAWSHAKQFTKSDPWPLPIVQTILLCEFYARYRGRKKGAHIASPHFARLYQMMNDPDNTFASLPAEGSLEQRWRNWIDMETRRRIFAACFLLDIHSMRYLEQPPTKIRGMDYTSHSTLNIPFSTNTARQWNVTKAKDWGALLNGTRPTKTLASVSLEDVTRKDIASISRFDGAVVLAGLSLRLPRRRSLTKIDLLKSPLDTDATTSRIAALFPDIGSANAYLALQHTPLHILLSVSGDSWVFNNKVPSPERFQDHRHQLRQWSKSGSAAVAIVFAAKALKAFLTPCVYFDNAGEPLLRPAWDDISDYWGFYACVLICWACGCNDEEEVDLTPFSVTVALQCVNTMTQLRPDQVHGLVGRQHARLVIGLGKQILMKDCLGGRSILFADAVNVLRKLDERDGSEW